MTIKVTYNVTDVYVTQDVSPVYINVSYSGGGSGGAAVWGGITGTLSDQTDLQAALDGKFDDPTGTTSQYLRGDGSLATFPAIPSGTVTSVGLSMPSAFSVANSPVTSSGTLAVTGAGDTTQYIAGDGSLVAFPITGQAGTLVREVRNVTGATLTKGTVVYINGASGNKPTVAKAIATSDATSAQTFGLIQADIPNNSNGYLVAFGDLDGLNTSAFAEGVQLYLSATTAGGYTSTKQYAPNHLVYIGVVTRQHVNQGRIEVRIQNGYEMDELHDVAAQTPSNNDGLFYNSTNSLWENKPIATALGYTPANAATTLTINGVTYDLSTSRTWSVGTITGSGASGQVAYWTGTSAQSGSNNLFWDATNGRLGIGTNAPANQLYILANANQATSVNFGLAVKNSNSTGYANTLWYNDLNEIGQFLMTGSGGAIAGTNIAARQANFVSTSANGVNIFAANATGYITLAAGNSSTSHVRLYSNGNLGINTSTDSGQRLQVQGTTLLNGNVTFSSSTGMFWDATNSRLGIGTNVPATILDISSNGGRLRFTQSVSGSVFNGIEFATSGGVAYASLAGNQNTGEIRLSTNASYFPTFYASGSEGMRLTTNRNLLLQNGGTFTDSGERLQVTGTMKVTGNTKIGNTVFTDTASNIIIGVDGTAARGAIANNFTFQDFQFVNTSVASGNINSWSFGQRRDTFFGNTIGSFQIVGAYIDNTGAGSMVGGGFRVPLICNPNGDVLINGGSANVVNRYIGLGVNSPTALTDIGASTTTRASLRIRSGTAPTSPNDGDIWFDGTDIKMRIGGVTKTFTLI